MYSREDWTLFRNLNTISQKAGVPIQNLRALVLKELVDNAMDASGSATIECRDDGWYIVSDNGPGIPDTVNIAELFSINRPLTSSKILRVPSRGALGNGLRVVVGTILASGGELEVITGGYAYKIAFNHHTGKSGIASKTPLEKPGTTIRYRLGDSVPKDRYEQSWAKLSMATKHAQVYKGKSSPWWYDSDSFFELLLAADLMTTCQMCQEFVGVDKAMDIDLEGLPESCRKFSREDADKLLGTLRNHCKPVRPKQIGCVDWSVKKYGEITIPPGHGIHSAILPYVVEAYASPINEDAAEDTEETTDEVIGMVNATPITGELTIDRRGKTTIALFGCGLSHKIERVSRRKFQLFLNITIPYMPITTDGKEPNFKYFLPDIAAATSKATRRLKSELKKRSGGAIREIILRKLDRAVDKVSEGGKYRYSLRQLFYVVRPYVLENGEAGDLDYNYFGRVIGEYEAENGELDKMYRDPRGTLYHPHTGETIPVGTIAVEEYERPKWTFQHILFIEKEGLFEVLKQAKIPERYDIALLSSKGFASRAAKDLIDLLGNDKEKINVYCMHDADGAGTMIYQTLAGATLSRASRRVIVHNLGLEPWEGVEMGLQVESFPARKTLTPVAEYVDKQSPSKPYNFRFPERLWSKWLQSRRIELNAMTSPQFLRWVEHKLVAHGVKKIVPPTAVIEDTYQKELKQSLRSNLANRILRDAGIDSLVESHLQSAQTPASLVDKINEDFSVASHHQWRDAVIKLANQEAARAVTDGDLS